MTEEPAQVTESMPSETTNSEGAAPNQGTDPKTEEVLSPEQQRAEISRQVQKQQDEALVKQSKEDTELVQGSPEIFSKLSEKRQKRVADLLGETIEDLANKSAGDVDEEDERILKLVRQETEKQTYKSEQKKVEAFLRETIDDIKLAQSDKEAITEEFETLFSDIATTKQTLDRAQNIMKLARLKVLGQKAIEEEEVEKTDAVADKTAASIGLTVNRSVKKDKGLSESAQQLSKRLGLSNEDLKKYSNNK